MKASLCLAGWYGMHLSLSSFFFFCTTAIEPFTTAAENGKYIFEVLEHLDSSRWSVSVNQTQKQTECGSEADF